MNKGLNQLLSWQTSLLEDFWLKHLFICWDLHCFCHALLQTFLLIWVSCCNDCSCMMSWACWAECSVSWLWLFHNSFSSFLMVSSSPFLKSTSCASCWTCRSAFSALLRWCSTSIIRPSILAIFSDTSLSRFC